MSCDGCHASVESSRAEWGKMSGHHQYHLDQGFTCATCHETTRDDQTIARGDLHIDGTPEMTPPASSSIVFDPVRKTCDGTCHDERHVNRAW
jgi:hypothetical protein